MQKRLFLVIISLFLLHKGISQSLDDSYKIAIKNIDEKKYENALVLLKRIAFFADSSFKPLVYMQLGDVYAFKEAYSEAKSYYETAFFSTHNDSLKAEITFRQSALLLLENQPDLVIKMLDYALPRFINSKIENRINLYKTLAWIEKNQLDSAQVYCQKSFSEPNFVKIDSIFNLARKVHYYSPRKAKMMSSFLPGLGQLYIKDYKNAANSFVINAGLLGFSIFATLNYSWFEGCVLILPWWQKYYIGGMQRAELLAEKRNQLEKNKVVNLIYKLSENNK